MRKLTMLCAALLTVLALWGQSTGEVAGTVTDATGAALVGASLRLTNDATGVAWNGATNDAGQYRFGSLPPGPYTLVVRAAGFNDTRLSGIMVEVARTARADVAMQVAATQQEVNVVASAQLLDFDSSAKGTIITAAQIRNLPLQTRNPLALMTLTPGVAAPSGGRSASRQGADGTVISSNFTINGGTRNSTGGFQEYIVDGISITNQRDGSVSALPAADALQEFKVQSGGMSAEFNRTVGGVVNYVTQGGTNDYHGNLFEAHRSTATNARLAIPAEAEKPANVYNQFGGSIGGPLLIPRVYNGRNRSFFFFGYEGSRWVRNEVRLATIPTARMRVGDYSEITQRIYDPASAAAAASRTVFPNNQIPASRFNSFGKRILDLFPEANRPGVASNIAGPRRVFTPVDNYTGRFDQTLTDKQRVMFRVTRVESSSDQNWQLGPRDEQTQIIAFPSRSYTANYSYTIAPSLLYSMASGYTKFHRTSFDYSGNQDGAGFFGMTVTPTPASGSPANVRAAARFDIYRGLGLGSAQDQLAESYQTNHSLSWTRGRHTLRFGTDIRRYSAGGQLTGGAPNGTFTFNALQTSNGTATTGNSAASTLLGMTNALSFSQPPRLNARKWVTGLFVQDDWRVTSRLTLNLGLRWDGEGALTEAENRVGYFDSAATHPVVGRPGIFRYAGLGGAPRDIIRRDFNNWSPRAGFAWSPDASRRMSVRGAFAIYNTALPTIGSYAAAVGFEPILQFVKPSAADPANILQASYALPPPSGPLGDEAYLGQGFTQPLDRSIQVPRVYQWNFGVQRELARNTVIEAVYAANRGLRLLSSFNLNLPQQALIEEAIGRTQSTGNPGAALAFLNERVNNPLAGKVPGTLGAATITRAQAAAAYPHYAGVSSWVGNRDSIYHSLQVNLQKRLSGDLNFMIAYTFSKQIENVSADSGGVDNNIGTIQNPYNLRDSRAVGSFDRPHYVAANFIYELPFGRSKRYFTSGPMNYLLGGFQLTGILQAHSGMPLAITQSAANGLGVGGARPDVVGDPVKASDPIRRTVASNGNVRWLDGSAYALVNGRFGNAPIRDDNVRGPNFWQLDFGLQRDFRLKERLSLRFRAESFNALNHTNLLNPVQDRSAPDFGQINGVFDSRIFQFGLELKF